jgi:membrane protease YdiL (CAAX protease family)
MIDPESLSTWQLTLLSGFTFLMLGGLAASLALHAWVIRNFQWLIHWQGWQRDRPRQRIGLVDLFLFVACMVVVQGLILSIVAATVGIKPRPVSGQSVSVGIMTPVVQDLKQDTGIAQDSIGGSSSTTSVGSDSTELSIDDGQDPSSVSGAKNSSSQVPPWLTPILTLSLLLGALLAALVIVLRTRASPVELGFWSNRLVADVWIGALVFLWVTPIVLIQSQIAVRWTEVEYEHPVIDAMRENPMAYPMLFFGAVICAPLWEEFAFRTLLIGWLDTVRASKWRLRTILFGQRPQGIEQPSDASTNTNFEDYESTISARLEDDTIVDSANSYPPINPYAVPPGSHATHSDFIRSTNQSFAELPRNAAPTWDEQPTVENTDADCRTEGYPPWWPAITSGVLFGLAHLGYGVSWIPLITLGVVLGRLFQLRRSLVPCVVVHGLFNSMSMIGLAINVFVQKSTE